MKKFLRFTGNTGNTFIVDASVLSGEVVVAGAIVSLLFLSDESKADIFVIGSVPPKQTWIDIISKSIEELAQADYTQTYIDVKLPAEITNVLVF